MTKTEHEPEPTFDRCVDCDRAFFGSAQTCPPCTADGDAQRAIWAAEAAAGEAVGR